MKELNFKSGETSLPLDGSGRELQRKFSLCPSFTIHVRPLRNLGKILKEEGGSKARARSLRGFLFKLTVKLLFSLALHIYSMRKSISCRFSKIACALVTLKLDFSLFFCFRAFVGSPSLKFYVQKWEEMVPFFQVNPLPIWSKRLLRNIN